MGHAPRLEELFDGFIWRPRNNHDSGPSADKGALALVNGSAAGLGFNQAGKSSITAHKVRNSVSDSRAAKYADTSLSKGIADAGVGGIDFRRTAHKEGP